MEHRIESKRLADKERPAAGLFALLRKRIASGQLAGGSLLPPVRELCKTYGMGPNTVLRAIKMLSDEGLVASEPRSGCRVLACANDPRRGCPLVFRLAEETVAEGSGLLYRRLAKLIDERARQYGSSLMTIVAADQEKKEPFFNNLRQLNAWGLIVDTLDRDVIEGARIAGLPLVAVDVWAAEANLDVVVQDDFGGGWLAAEYCVKRGHRRIGWLRPNVLSDHSRARFGGAAALLAEHGLALWREGTADTTTGSLLETAVRMLRAPDRPTAVLALWSRAAEAFIAACHSLRLKPGTDVEMVGWCPEEIRAETFVPMFEGGSVMPAIAWSISAMAETLVARLEERRTNPQLAATRIHIPTRLCLPA
jgi:DNA-binding LacI/PurR family transcriptional regulator